MEDGIKKPPSRRVSCHSLIDIHLSVFFAYNLKNRFCTMIKSKARKSLHKDYTYDDNILPVLKSNSTMIYVY